MADRAPRRVQMRDQLAASTLLSNWGSVTGLGGVPTERCFDARTDLVVPGVLMPRVILASPFLPFFEQHARDPAAAVAAAADPAAAHWAARRTLLFFHGALCWQTYDHVSRKGLERKCKQKHGFIDRYSFGVRYEVYRRHREAEGFWLRATDVTPKPPHANLEKAMLGSTFCLCPSGTGWGMRAFHAASLGCIPLIIQEDGSGAYPPVLQAFEGLLLDWDDFALRLPFREIANLPALLRAAAANKTLLARKRSALAAAWPRLLWRTALPPRAAKALELAPDAHDSVMQALALRMRHGVHGADSAAK
jgi:hypothetical protein